MEEYITRAEFEAFKQEVRQRQTDEIPVTRVEVASADVTTAINELKQHFDHELKTVSDTWLNTLQQNHTEHKNEMAAMEERLGDLIRKHSTPGKN